MEKHKYKNPIDRSHYRNQDREKNAREVKYNKDGVPYVTAKDCPMPRGLYQVRRLDEIRGRLDAQLTEVNSTYKTFHKTARLAYDRRRYLKARIEQEIDEKAKELKELDVQLAERERIRDLSSKAPTVKEMRAAVSQLFKDQNLNPIQELIKLAKKRGKDALPSKERAAILKELAQYQAPKPKAVDIQADMDMSVTVGMMDFRGTTQRMIKDVAPVVADEAYDEFEIQDGTDSRDGI